MHSRSHAHTKADTDRRASVVVLDWNCQRCHIKCVIIKSRLNFMALQDRKLVGQSLKLRIHRAMCSIRPHFSPALLSLSLFLPLPFSVYIHESLILTLWPWLKWMAWVWRDESKAGCWEWLTSEFKEALGVTVAPGRSRDPPEGITRVPVSVYRSGETYKEL